MSWNYSFLLKHSPHWAQDSAWTAVVSMLLQMNWTVLKDRETGPIEYNAYQTHLIAFQCICILRQENIPIKAIEQLLKIHLKPWMQILAFFSILSIFLFQLSGADLATICEFWLFKTLILFLTKLFYITPIICWLQTCFILVLNRFTIKQATPPVEILSEILTVSKNLSLILTITLAYVFTYLKMFVLLHCFVNSLSTCLFYGLCKWE